MRCDLHTLSGAPHRLTDWETSPPDHHARLVAWLREVLAVSVLEPWLEANRK